MTPEDRQRMRDRTARTQVEGVGWVALHPSEVLDLLDTLDRVEQLAADYTTIDSLDLGHALDG
jgi:hypothetical protein